MTPQDGGTARHALFAKSLVKGLAIVLLTMGLAACGSQPPAAGPTGAAEASRPAATATAPGRQDGVEAFERQQRERAETAQRQGRLADAALAWEVLTALKPQRSEYRERLAATRAQVRSGVAERLGKGDAAHKRGELDGAVQHYLAALALDPLNDTAADALRAIERERQKRPAGRLARDPLQRRAGGEADPRPHAPPAARAAGRPALTASEKAAKPAPAASSSR